MKVVIGEMDCGEIYWREEDDATYDDNLGLLKIWKPGTNHIEIKEIINMTSPNFHCVKMVDA